MRGVAAGMLAVLAIGVGDACGHSADHLDSVAEEPSATEAPAETEHATQAVVTRVGGTPLDAREMVAWALDRFAQADLRLPDRVEVIFDVSRQACHELHGCCQPRPRIPRAVVCEPAGTTAFRVMTRRITLLHELAHIWHWHRGDDTGWSDESAIVGGAVGDDVPWDDQMVERVAVVISWGLMDTKRRPVRTDLGCAELFEQFEQLTGRTPLGELEPVCRPDEAARTGSTAGR